jgi:hypothetical protein
VSETSKFECTRPPIKSIEPNQPLCPLEGTFQFRALKPAVGTPRIRSLADALRQTVARRIGHLCDSAQIPPASWPKLGDAKQDIEASAKRARVHPAVPGEHYDHVSQERESKDDKAHYDCEARQDDGGTEIQLGCARSPEN